MPNTSPTNGVNMDNDSTNTTPNTPLFAESDYSNTENSITEDGFDVANAADVAFKVIATIGAGCIIYNQFTGSSSEPAVVSEG